MVEAFGAMVRAGDLDGWQLVIVGGCEESQIPYLNRVQDAAVGLPVTIHANAPRELVQQLLATSAIFWSATGLGEDEDAAPWNQEHFGMTTVEAMAGGCVPIVIDRAGQREIVRPGVDGYRWATIEELVAFTSSVAADGPLRARLSGEAVERAKAFSDSAFANRWRALADSYQLLG
jgi:glycosyltransferase involved in cell wall biosynthesis